MVARSLGDAIGRDRKADDLRPLDRHQRWTRRQSGNIAHMYEARDRYDVSVDVIWEARWRIGTNPWQHLGYFTTSDSADYPVRQVIALLVKPH